ncbi:DNA mismatch repair protein MutS [Myxococcota bacterium]|nr:DNA mismatch repair protein MutS [Myxococcota bacterium]
MAKVEVTQEARYGIPAGVKLTPMMQQYIAAKARYPDAMLFFRMGDFYEMFFEDAEMGGRHLDLTVTSRDKKTSTSVPAPMSGFPHHQLSSYLARALSAGFKVAVCDQLTDPSQSRGLVERGITRVVTPGVILDSEGLDAQTNHYLAAITRAGGEVVRYGLSALDASTGLFRVTEVIGAGALRAELSRLEPKEVLLMPGVVIEEAKERLKRVAISHPDARFFDPASPILDRLVGPKGEGARAALSDFGFGNPNLVLSAAVAVLNYVADTQGKLPEHTRVVEPYRVSETLVLDDAAKSNLELFRTLIEGRKRGALLGTLDQTITSMGARRLRQWLAYPLVDPARINTRLDAVEALYHDASRRAALRADLQPVYDLERLNGRIAAESAGPRDLWFLRLTLERLPQLRARLADLDALAGLTTRLDPLEEVLDLLQTALADDPPSQLKDGGVIRQGFHEELDELISLSKDGKSWLLELEAREREVTGIGSLKVRYNRVFGYYIEVSKVNLRLVPDRYIRKQTLANSERYFTEELKDFEEKVLNAEGRRGALESELFTALRGAIGGFVDRIGETATALAELDALAGLAELAHKGGYCRPVVDEGEVIEITEGRHPVVEESVGREAFVPNSLRLDMDTQSLIILTGPNMAGKSTVMRQVALITLMAQMGSFVPASAARIGVVDRIFTRVGAADDLASGRSTFMVEMHEAATILKEATPRSLLILDEIGRGTSTFDGVSIAWAVCEYVHDVIGARTLFATHYHELTELTKIKRRARNFTIAIKEWNEDVIFLRQLIEGSANRSYGIQVARLAGLPKRVVERAKEVLNNLHAEEQPRAATDEATPRGINQMQLSLFSPPPLPAAPSKVEQALMAADLDNLTPLQAVNFLHTLRAQLD